MTEPPGGKAGAIEAQGLPVCVLCPLQLQPGSDSACVQPIHSPVDR